MSSQRLVFRNGFVVSMDPDIGEIPNGEVLVEDGVIVDVGPDLGVSDAEEIDATGMIVMPGFVDTHRHTWQTPVRGVLPCCTLDNYFAVMLGSVGGHYRPEDVHVGNYAGSLEAINGGVTTLLDWSHINNTPDHSDAAVQGLKDAGIRAIYAHGVPDGRRVVVVQRPEPSRGHPPHPRHVLLLRRSAPDARACGSGAGQLELRGRDARLGARARARHPDQRPRRHAAVDGPRDPRQEHARPRPARPRHDLHPLHGLDRRGARPDRIDRRHGLDRAVRRDAHGPRPASDGQAARTRRPPVAQRRRRLERAGRDVHPDAHGARLRPDRRITPTRRTSRSRRRCTHRDVLEFATIDGARACALEDKVGSLTPSKQADIVLLNVNAINTMPMVDPIGRSSSSPTRRTSTRCSSQGEP